MFIKSDCSETEFIELARSFENYQDALSFCQRHRLKGVELVVQNTSAKDEFTVSIQSAPLR
jgi:hypothetical protein